MSTITRKIASVSVSVITAVSLSGAAALVPVASAQSVADLQAQIANLLAQIQALQAQLSAAQGGGGGSSYNFTRDLTVGSRGDDVKALQQWLNANGYPVAASGPGSPGNETTYFGNATKAALAKYQAAKGISPASGYFGPKTRAALAAAGSGVPPISGGVPVSGASLRVESAGPAAMTIPDGSIYNSLLKLKLTAGSSDVSVTGVIVTRGGFIANTNVTGVSVWDDAGNRYGNIISSLTSDGQATLSFGSKPFVVPAGQTRYLTLAANISSSAGSGSVSFSVMKASDISVSGNISVNGNFPIVGNSMTVVDGDNSLGDLRVDDQSVAGLAYSSITSAEGNVEIGEPSREVYKFRLTQNNSKEAVRVERIALYVEGTFQEAKDLKNWTLYSPEGSVLATAAQSYDRYVTFNLASPYVIDKGLSKDFTVKVDIADGANNYFRLYFQNDYDILARGVTTGAGVLPRDSGGGELTAVDTQFGNGGFKMKQGSLTVSRSSGSPSGAVAPSAQNVVLAKFDLRSAGERLEVQKMYVGVKYAGVALTGSLSVRDAQTGENYLSISADTSGLQFTSTPGTTADLSNQNLSSYFTIESGQTKSLEVVGNVSANATSTSNYTAYVGGFYVKRFSTNDYTTTPATTASPVSGNQLDVRDVSLTITKSTSFSNTNRSKGAQNVKIAEYTFQASAADDIRVNSLSFNLSYATSVQNLKLMDGTTQLGSTIGSPSASANVFSPSNFTISKSQTKVLALYADILSSAGTGVVVSSSLAASGVSGFGVTTGKTLSSTPSSDVVGQSITIQTPTLTIDKDPNSQTSRIYLPSQTGVELDRVRFEAKNENLTLNKITLQFTSPSSTQWAADTDVQSRIARVYLYDGSTLLNSGGTVPQNGNVVIDNLNVSLPQDTQKALIVKADINDVSGMTTSTASPIVGGIQVKSNSSADLEVRSGSAGLLSSSAITLTNNAASNYFLFHGAAPTIANVCSSYSVCSGGGTSQDSVVAVFRITNNGARPITIASTTIAANLGGALNTSSTVSDFRLFNEVSGAPGTQIASASGFVSATSTSADFTFSSWSSDSEIGVGASKTYFVKANTTQVRSGTGSGTYNPNLTLSISGSTGYSSSVGASSKEYFWNHGGVTYSYTFSNGNVVTPNSASDSYPITGTTLNF